MAINQVNIPQNESSLSKMGRLASVAGPIAGLIPGGQAAGAALSAVGSLSGLQSQQTSVQNQPLETYGAMRRRQQQSNPDQTIAEALSALDSLDLSDDEYRKYQAPLYQALQRKA